MSDANVKLVQSLYAAFGRGDIATILAAATPDIDWQTVGRSSDYPIFGPRKGVAAVQDFFRLVAENQEFSDFTPREFYAADGKVFALGAYSGRMKKTGAKFASEWVHVFDIANGKVTRFREHTDTAQFAEAYRKPAASVGP
jgi:ketosteroid isomerase-like protein